MYRKMTLIIPIICGFLFASSIIEVSGNKTEFDINQVSPSIIHVNITTGDIITFNKMTDEREFTHLSLPGFHLSRNIGMPELPEIHRLIEIPTKCIASC